MNRNVQYHSLRYFQLLIAFLLFCFQAQAQFPYPDSDLAKLTSGRKLAVQLLEEISETETSINQVLKEAFDQTMTLSEVEYFSPGEFKELIKSRTNDYYFLSQPSELPTSVTDQFAYLKGDLGYWAQGAFNEPTHLGTDMIKEFRYDQVPLDYYTYSLSLFDGKKENDLTAITFVNGILNRHDFIYLSQQTQILLQSAASGTYESDFIDVPANIEQLNQSTLLIPKDFFEEGAEFSKALDQPFEMLDFHDYLKKIVACEKESTYLKFIFSLQHNQYLWVAVETSSGRTLGLVQSSSSKNVGTVKATSLIKPRDLKSLFNENSQLLNNYYRR